MRKKDKRAKQERNLASGESAAVCRPVGMPAQPGTLSQGRVEWGGGGVSLGPGAVGGALPNRLTGRRWGDGREGVVGEPEASRTVRLPNKSLPSSGTQSVVVGVVGGGWRRGVVVGGWGIREERQHRCVSSCIFLSLESFCTPCCCCCFLTPVNGQN